MPLHTGPVNLCKTVSMATFRHISDRTVVVKFLSSLECIVGNPPYQQLITTGEISNGSTVNIQGKNKNLMSEPMKVTLGVVFHGCLVTMKYLSMECRVYH